MAETKKYARIKKASVDGVWYADKIGNVYEVDRENCVSILTKRGIRGLSSVLREDAELIVTEKRPAKVGERVLITAAYAYTGCPYKNGDINNVKTADKHGHVLVEEHSVSLLRREYEVIVNNEVKNEEADGMKIDLNAMGDRELYAHGEAVMEAIKKRMFQAGFRAAKQAQRKLAGMNSKKTPQARRDEIVEQAKTDVEELSNYGDGVRYETGTGSFATCNVEFVVNRDKRTVVALLKGVRTGDVYAKGIAKAAPDDCFNVRIGKAIALRRALGLAVPDEYLNAPQPTEVRVGDVVYGKYSEAYYQLWCEDEIGDVSYEVKIKEIVDGKYRYVGGGYDFIDDADLTIIDDSREGVVGE
ncbi:hypothetical protein RY279_06715 [Bacillus velezensis]|uniref:hypothetical protein n=1 Tax=Bacillus velezensis TaxID=492670 RepID=UPI001C64ABC7|nr:hypothetical protein [Bacillus velezensis]MDP1503090.1 hypothetical protein [Bacillus velezensis]MDP1506949.1 hypothetical protein [Bacillus velezensis]